MKRGIHSGFTNVSVSRCISSPILFMKSVNKVTLLGHVTRDAEQKSTATGRAVSTFGLATNRFWRDAKGARQENAEFHNIVCFGKLAELCGKYVKKGKPLMIEGALKTGNWETDGVKHSRTEVVAKDIVLLGSKEQEAAVEYPEKSAEDTEEVA